MSLARSVAAAVAVANVINEVRAVVLREVPKQSGAARSHPGLDFDPPQMPRIVLPALPEVPRPLSLAEVEANMTIEESHRIFHGIVEKAGLHDKFFKGFAFLQQSSSGQLRGVQKHSVHGGSTRAADNDTIHASLTLVTTLIAEKEKAHESCKQMCEYTEGEKKHEIQQLGQQISEAQKESSVLVGNILLLQAQTRRSEEKIDTDTALMEEKRQSYDEQHAGHTKDLEGVTADHLGMTNVLNGGYLNCTVLDESVITPSLVQAHVQARHSAVECRECENGVKVGLLEQEMGRHIRGMTSKVGKEALQGLLVESGAMSGHVFLEVGDREGTRRRNTTGDVCNETMAADDDKGKLYMGCQDKTIDGQECLDWAAAQNGTTAERNLLGNYCRNPEGSKSTIYCKVEPSPETPGGFQFCVPKQDSGTFPESVEAPHCDESTGCVLTKGSCATLQNKFQKVTAALEERKADLETTIGDLESSWTKELNALKEMIAYEKDELGKSQAALATDKGTLHTTQSEMTTDTQLYRGTVEEFQESMKECCDTKSELVSEKCALDKVRQQLANETGTDIVDCKESDWQDEDVPGGAHCYYPHNGNVDEPRQYHGCVMQKFKEEHAAKLVKRQVRTVLLEPSYGTPCEILEQIVVCDSLPPCDVDCVQSQWSQFSSCSAECDGGTSTSTRETKREADGGGKVCGPDVFARDCNQDPCNQDCELAEWQDWGGCSRSCTWFHAEGEKPMGGFGHSERTRDVLKEPTGTGEKCRDPRQLCDPDAPDDTCRLESRECNQDKMCVLDGESNLIKCGGSFNLYFLVDSSGSLGKEGFEAEQNFVVDIMKSLGTHVSTLVLDWSGPNWWYQRVCRKPAFMKANPDLCGFNWVQPTPTLDHVAAEEKVEDMKFQWKYTFAHTAMDFTREKINQVAMETNSTSSVQNVVVLLIDGSPTYGHAAKKSAEKLKDTLGGGKLVVMALNNAARYDYTRNQVMNLASDPKEDNFVTELSFTAMASSDTKNKLLLTMCPDTDGPASDATVAPDYP